MQCEERDFKCGERDLKCEDRYRREGVKEKGVSDEGTD